MLTLQQINTDKEAVIESLKIRNRDYSKEINLIIETDNLRKQTQAEQDKALAEANNLAQQIGKLFKEGKGDEAKSAKEKAKIISKLTLVVKNQNYTTKLFRIGI